MFDTIDLPPLAMMSVEMHIAHVQLSMENGG